MRGTLSRAAKKFPMVKAPCGAIIICGSWPCWYYGRRRGAATRFFSRRNCLGAAKSAVQRSCRQDDLPGFWRMKILAIQFRYFGDAALMVPALRALREHFRECALHLLVPAEVTPLFEHLPWLTRV